MKLSLKRKFGWVHVRGGRFRRVLTTHPVKTSGESSLESRAGKPREADTVFAHAGDLAIEIVNVKLDTIIGYAYLSGDAIRLNSYEAKPEWFGDATAIRIDVHTPGSVEGETTESFMAGLARSFTDIKFNHDAGVFRYRAAPGEDVKQMVRVLGGAYGYESTDGTKPRGHIFGVIKQGRKGGATIQFQPPGQASDLAASNFQIALAVDSVKKEKS